jgi:integrase
MSDLIEAHLAHLRASGHSPRTIRARADILTRLHHDLPTGIEAPTTDELDRWLGRASWTNATRYTYASHIRAFYTWACGGRHPHLDWNPAEDMARPKVPRWLPRPVTDDELRTALARAPEPYLTAILLAAYAGLRQSEILTLDRRDVTPEVIYVAGKGGRRDAVPTHPVVWAHLFGWPAGPIIRLADGRRPHRQYLTDSEKRLFTAMGLPAVRYHRFRHWYATTMLAAVGDLRVVQECMRHASVTSTEIYTYVADGQRRLAINSLPVLTTPQQGAA